MKKEKLYYKVVSVSENGTLKSCVQYNTPLSTYYSKGKWTKPNPRLLDLGYGLTVFSSLEAAKRFKNEYEKQHTRSSRMIKSWAIYSCEIGKTKTKKILICTSPAATFEGTLEWLQQDHSMRNDNRWPRGTVFCSKIKLLKEI